MSPALYLTVLGKACLLSLPVGGPRLPLAFSLDVLSLIGCIPLVYCRVANNFLSAYPTVGLEYCVENDGEVDRKECCAHLARSSMGKGGQGSTILP